VTAGTSNSEASTRASLAARNRRVAIAGLGVVAMMVGVAYAAVPLYRIFCQATGYGGTTRQVDASGDVVLSRVIKVRFDANVSAGINWSFKPAQEKISLNVGETKLAFYTARNLGKNRITGTATFNVTPAAAGQYFNKIECFCFTEQSLDPGEQAEMPVSFYIDPEIDDDPDLKWLKTITLSYTFFPAKTGQVSPKSAAKVTRPVNRIN